MKLHILFSIKIFFQIATHSDSTPHLKDIHLKTTYQPIQGKCDSSESFLMWYTLWYHLETVSQRPNWTYHFHTLNEVSLNMWSRPNLLTLFNLNPSMDNNQIHYNVWDKITYSYQTSTVQLLKFQMGKWFQPKLYWTCYYLSMQVLKLMHVSKRVLCW